MKNNNLSRIISKKLLHRIFTVLHIGSYIAFFAWLIYNQVTDIYDRRVMSALLILPPIVGSIKYKLKDKEDKEEK